MRMIRHYATAALVLFATRGVGAQPAPAAPAPPVEAQPPVESQPPVVPQPVLEPTPAPEKDAKPIVHIVYDNGTKFFTDDDKFELKVQFRNQMRFQATRSFQEETATRHNQWRNVFVIPRSRLQAEGHVFGEDNRYKLELALGDSGSFSFIKDMYIQRRLPGGGPTFLRFGQWRRPFNRPEIVSDFASLFNERSIQNDQAGGGRDLGVSLGNQYEKSPPVEWVVGVFNTFSGGTDRPTWTTVCVQNPATSAITCTNTRPTTVPELDWQPAIVARLGYNHGKIKGYSEGDLEGGPLRYAVAASYKVDLANFTGVDNMQQGFEVDTNIKANGFSLLAAADVMLLRGADPAYGFVVQPAYLVLPKHLEIAGRLALTTGDQQPGAMAGTVVETNQLEARIGVNYYWVGHRLKVANDAGVLFYTSDEVASHQPTFQLRMMMQLEI